MELIGLIPAAGRATRLGLIDKSKEVLPLPHRPDKVFSSFLMEAYQKANINNVYFIIREGKWDIPGYYGNGSKIGMNICYLMMQYPYGVPFTLNEAYPFVKDKYVALGFPDMLVRPKNAFKLLHEKIVDTHADLTVGLFPIETKEKWDMVDFDKDGNISGIVIKEKRTDLKYGWSTAVWGPKFSAFMNEIVSKEIEKGDEGKVQIGKNHFRELYPGDLFQMAINKGLKVNYVKFEDGECLDMGTYEDIKKLDDMINEFEV